MRLAVIGSKYVWSLPGHVAHARHMFPGKQQVPRIDEAGLHEALGLLRAPAGIGFVHQAALVVQEIVEIAPRPRQLLPEVVAADLQKLGADEIGHAEDLAEDVDEALLAVEAQQHARGAADPGFVHQQPNVGRHGSRIRQIQVWRAVQAVAVSREGPPGRVGPPPLHVQDVIDDDPVQPGAKTAAGGECRQLRDQLDEDLLSGVFGVLREVHHAKHDVVDPGLVAGNQLFKRFPIAALGALHQIPILWIGDRAVRKGISHAVSLDTGPTRL
jgi:hypothetical protein